MKRSSLKLGRKVRVILLLMLLSAQGMVSAHEWDSIHSANAHGCLICVVGHGLGSVIPVQPDLPQVRLCSASIPPDVTSYLPFSHREYYSTRAPPSSL
jgi:hypothetical protein